MPDTCASEVGNFSFLRSVANPVLRPQSLSLIAHCSVAYSSFACLRSVYGIGENDAAMIDNFLEFPSSLRTPLCRQEGFAAKVRWIEASKERLRGRARS